MTTKRPFNAKRWHLALAACLLTLVAAFLALIWHNRDREFRGRPESQWIRGITYSPPDEEVEQWRRFGPDGIHVLGRALNRHDRLAVYYRKIWDHVPAGLWRYLPKPKLDSSREMRMRVLSLLARLDDHVELAVPQLMAAMTDHHDGIRGLAIACLTQAENDNTVIHRVDGGTKRKLLRLLLDAANDRDWSVRNNAANALKYFPEHKGQVVPVLIPLLRDPIPQVQLVAASGLSSIAPEKMGPSGAVTQMVTVLKNPEPQIAYRAAELLGIMRHDPDLSVPALLEAARGTNSLVAHFALSALARFPDQRELIIGELSRMTNGSNGARAQQTIRLLNEKTPRP